MKLESVIEAVSAYEPRTFEAGRLAPAAVLVALRAAQPRGTELVLTRRAAHLGAHAGQVAFPGGKVDPGDHSVEGAALREAWEELGIAETAVRLIGRLDHVPSVTGYHVTPVVGVVDGEQPLVPNPDEVARVFTVPVSELMRLERWEQRDHEYRGAAVPVWHFPWDGEDIWGMTAYLLRGFVEMLHAFYRSDPP